MNFDKGAGACFGSLGCVPRANFLRSSAKTVSEIPIELRNPKIAERSGRAQDEGRGMEEHRTLGHM